MVMMLRGLARAPAHDTIFASIGSSLATIFISYIHYPFSTKDHHFSICLSEPLALTAQGWV